MPRSSRVSGCVCAVEHDGAGAVAEQHAGGAVGPVENARKGLRADHQRAGERARLEQAIGRRQRVDEAGAHRLQVEGGAMGDAELGLHRHGAGRKGVVRRRGRQHDEIDRLRIDLGMGERGARCVHRHVRGQFAGRGDAALVDAGALHDPVVGGVDLARQIGVGEDLRRQIAAAAENDRTLYRHEATPPTAWRAGLPGRPSAAVILARSSSRTTP